MKIAISCIFVERTFYVRTSILGVYNDEAKLRK